MRDDGIRERAAVSRGIMFAAHGHSVSLPESKNHVERGDTVGQ